ncbi:MAG: thiamine pyrophosphate-dependent enzyme [Elusimicrobiales bacterium]|nr:thiamine pyrophosphate-dependent enzyme [Elusimicrobiales bacterium]
METETMEKLLLMGDEAVGRAAIDAQLGGAFGYPGTPSTEIFEYLQEHSRKTKAFPALWAANEKVAFEEALGMSYAGKRAIVTMKSVGLNVAADPFICSAITGVNGGLVAAIADDPGMHSSQNEQDARYYAEFARVPCFEPANQQECYNMAREAFKFSEEHGLPVLLRLVTRIAHSRAPVNVFTPDSPRPEISLPPQDSLGWVLLPGVARKRFPELLKKRAVMAEKQGAAEWNYVTRYKDAATRKKGIIACGTGYNYLMEAFDALGLRADFLKISFYPVSPTLIRNFMEGRGEILVLEDGYPFLEERLLGLAGAGPKVRGRLDGTMPTTGELNPDKVCAAVAKVFGGMPPQPYFTKPDIPERPPMLCQGCPHTDTYHALNSALAERRPARVFSDIGCYTLGALKPHEAIHSCVEMGASIGMARGAADGGLKYSVAVIGDSTFGHSGMTALLGAAAANAPVTVFILDNGTTAMTGAQKSLSTGARLDALLAGLGVSPEHVRVITPLPARHGENARVIGEELDYRGLSVIIARRECIQILGKKK